jgi:hypothetical protein
MIPLIAEKFFTALRMTVPVLDLNGRGRPNSRYLIPSAARDLL